MVKCLIVDDSAIIRRILSVMLARLGFAIIEADSGSGAVALCQNDLPDLALIDWHLPDEDGISLVSQLRRLPGGEKIKLIICTVERSVTLIENALAAGADEYITKPFGFETLETKLGYLGFDVAAAKQENPALPSESLCARRQFSRIGFAGMTVAEESVANFQAGDVIFRQGDVPDFAYILLDGQVALANGQNEGVEAIVTVEPYSLFGDLALVENTPRALSATALSDCTLMKIARTRFQSELEALSPFMRNWVESLTNEPVMLLNHRRESK
jgi:two-component system chemotaxis response regulator CheY